MVEGNYNLKLSSPIGDITGILNLYQGRSGLEGILETMGSKNMFYGGIEEDNKFTFTGEFKTPIGPITYEALGILNGNNLDIYTGTNKGRFKITGTKI